MSPLAHTVAQLALAVLGRSSDKGRRLCFLLAISSTQMRRLTPVKGVVWAHAQSVPYVER